MKLFYTHYLYVSPSKVYCLWLYLKDGVLTLDQFSPRLERDREREREREREKQTDRHTDRKTQRQSRVWGQWWELMKIE